MEDVVMNYENLNANEYCKTIIEKINSLLEQKSLKQIDLATRCNISQSSLSKILKGEMRLTLQHIFKISIALDITPEELLSLKTKNFDGSPKTCYSNYTDLGIINEQYMNEQVLIRDKNHPAFNGYADNIFFIYLYSTINTESFLLEGKLSFDTRTSTFCKADLILNTGKFRSDGTPIEKHYYGELIISLTMGACYCVMSNPDIGEICFINFRHMFIFNQNLECRVGTISSTSSGGNRLPVIQRILLSKNELHVSGRNQSDLEFVQGQLRLNNSKILVSAEDLNELKQRYADDQNLTSFFEAFGNMSQKKDYYILEETNLQDITIPSNIKTRGLGILRNYSPALRYNKISTKTDEFVFDYISNIQN